MIEGLWTVRTKGVDGFGGAVVFLANGKIFGGDNGFYFLGTYYSDVSTMKARVTVNNFDSAIQSIFGLPSPYDLDVSATIQGKSMNGTAMVAGQPTKSVGIQLEKRADP